jgi:hypothetical protein
LGIDNGPPAFSGHPDLKKKSMPCCTYFFLSPEVFILFGFYRLLGLLQMLVYLLQMLLQKQNMLLSLLVRWE